MELSNVIEKSGTPIITDLQIEQLAEKHSELCHGVYASFNGGAKFEDVEPLLIKMLDQASEISSLLMLKKAIQ
ncbi:hypothetical protein AN214_04344 [Pseudoalteromonas sp. P1-9]|uniref:hypothetical protein n=1 Tax=Pseudoalteromonas sp. P1-9 TaxID=1710354 RepID=UPI0006D5F794|nr:hypothetical protein [Pseudoalteromonas sp. P1-9]KPV93622.1 hypothetical protein AN214_04344 [Pseudoalteromonas sp. P1-9]